MAHSIPGPAGLAETTVGRDLQHHARVWAAEPGRRGERCAGQHAPSAASAAVVRGKPLPTFPISGATCEELPTLRPRRVRGSGTQRLVWGSHRAFVAAAARPGPCLGQYRVTGTGAASGKAGAPWVACHHARWSRKRRMDLKWDVSRARASSLMQREALLPLAGRCFTVGVVERVYRAQDDGASRRSPGGGSTRTPARPRRSTPLTSDPCVNCGAASGLTCGERDETALETVRALGSGCGGRLALDRAERAAATALAICSDVSAPLRRRLVLDGPMAAPTSVQFAGALTGGKMSSGKSFASWFDAKQAEAKDLEEGEEEEAPEAPDDRPFWQRWSSTPESGPEGGETQGLLSSIWSSPTASPAPGESSWIPALSRWACRQGCGRRPALTCRPQVGPIQGIRPLSAPLGTVLPPRLLCGPAHGPWAARGRGWATHRRPSIPHPAWRAAGRGAGPPRPLKIRTFLHTGLPVLHGRVRAVGGPRRVLRPAVHEGAPALHRRLHRVNGCGRSTAQQGARPPRALTVVPRAALTLYAALVLKNYLAVVAASLAQLAALGWYGATFIPGGQAGMTCACASLPHPPHPMIATHPRPWGRCSHHQDAAERDSLGSHAVLQDDPRVKAAACP